MPSRLRSEEYPKRKLPPIPGVILNEKDRRDENNFMNRDSDEVSPVNPLHSYQARSSALLETTVFSSSVYSQSEWEMDPELPDNMAVLPNTEIVDSNPSAYARSASKSNTIVKHGWTPSSSYLGPPETSWVDYTESISPLTPETLPLESNTGPSHLQEFKGNTSCIEPEYGGQTMELSNPFCPSNRTIKSEKTGDYRDKERLILRKCSRYNGQGYSGGYFSK